MPVKPRIKFAPGKTYIYSGSEGVYSVIAGELLEGEGVTPSGGGLSFGNGSPLSLNGKDGDVYLDLTDFKIHTKSGGGWSAGSGFKGTNGSNGSNGTNGKSIRFGNGAPLSGLGDNDDVYLDLSDFKVHTKSAGSWSGGTAFKGSNGSNGSNGINGKSIKWGNGAPIGSPGDDDDLYFDLDNFHVYPKSAGAWNAAGKKLFKGDAGSNGVKGASLLQGAGSPLAGAGDDGDTFLDTTNHVIYKKSGGAWASQGSSFKGTNGTNGSNGSNGNTLLQGSGAPSSGSGADGDSFLDTTNHVVYKKSGGSWSAQGSSFKGATGAGVSKFSCALTADTYISTGNTQSTATQTGSTTGVPATTYPATLYLTDDMEDVGGIVTRSDVKYRKNAADTLPFDLTGSKFTINTAGRYKIDYNATFNVQAATSSANSVDLTAFIDYSTDGGSTYTTMVTQTATMTTASTTAAQTTLELTRTIFLPASTTIFFKAKRGDSTVNTVVSVNAITKTEVGDDTFIVITKL